MRRRLAALLVLLGAVLGAGFVLAGGASAHASVISSDPADGSRLASVPSAVTLTFDESVGLGGAGYLHVIDQGGRRVDSGVAFHPGGDGAKVTQNLKPGLGDGTYTGSYRVVSADSHPVTGSMRFVVGTGVLAGAAVDSSAVNRVTSVAFDIGRWISFAGFALLGGAWLLMTVWPQGRDDRRAGAIVWTGWGLTGLGAIAELLLQGPYAAGTGLSDLSKWSILDATLHSDYGQFHCGRLLLLGGLGLLLGRVLQASPRGSRAEGFAGPLALGIALTFSSIGHAETTSPRLLSIAADVLHLLAMAAWLGGLVVLVAAVLPRREPAELRAVLPVFSKVAFGSVVVLAVTGSYAAWRGVGTVHAIFTTSYGLLVVVKIALFLGLLALGNISRGAVQRRFARVPVAYAMTDVALDEHNAAEHGEQPPEGGVLDPIEAERLRRSVLVEIVLAICVLVATAVLVAEPRGKEAIATRELRPASASADIGGGRRATVTITPSKHGTVAAELVLSPGAVPKQLTASAALPAKQLGPIPVALTANGANDYAASGINLPVAGDWVISLVVTRSEFDATTASVKIHLD
jgi:copper transport protein